MARQACPGSGRARRGTAYLGRARLVLAGLAWEEAVTELTREVHEIASRADLLGEPRRSDVTASAAAALFGEHPFLSREQYAARLRGTSDAGTSSVPDSPAMRRGRVMEAGVAVAVAEERPHWTLEKAHTYHRIAEMRIGASPDFWITSTDPAEPGRGILEVKTASQQQWEKWHGQLPLAYHLQVQVQLLCTGCEWGWIALMVTSPSLPVFYWPAKPHAGALERIKRAAAQFHTEIETGHHLGAAASAEGLAQIFDDGSTIDLSGDNQVRELLEERAMRHESANAEDKRIKEIDDIVKAKIGAAARAFVPGWSISYATHHRKQVVLAAKDVRTLRIRRSREEEEEVEE